MLIRMIAGLLHRQRSSLAYTVCLLGAAGLFLQSELAWADPEPEAGMLLVATRDLRDPNFSETVVLLVYYGEDGAMGLVINRPTQVEVAELLPDLAGAESLRQGLFIGGPVALSGVMMLVLTSGDAVDATRIFGDVHVSGSMELLGRLLGDGADNRQIRLFAGHSGWGPGQLDQEIDRGSWRVLPATERIVFTDQPRKIWKQLAPADRKLIVEARCESEQRDRNRQPDASEGMHAQCEPDATDQTGSADRDIARNRDSGREQKQRNGHQPGGEPAAGHPRTTAA